ncbi:hypothetical protein [Polyangium sp. 6x1]|uniref:hypothetical protein n=1 Tax=Polyangium sp. 6x1 TaxID=3042689 RepID=UPI0024824654|nr:hypothetical protein [Polyangium sp. 6x1]MDI1446412.1 hypothetical protein [Polyangium sp. 6x1]
MRNWMFVSMVASMSLLACTTETVDDAELAAPEAEETALVAAPRITIDEVFELSRGLPTSRPTEDGLEISAEEATDPTRCGQGQWVRVKDDSPEGQAELEALRAAFTNASGIDVGKCTMCGYDLGCWWQGKERLKSGYYYEGNCFATNTSQCCN